MNNLRFRQCSAELIGTFILASSVGLSLLHAGPVPTAVIAALTLGVQVYVIGPLCGCHINPAVTVGIWSVGKIDMVQALQYILAQLFGGILAMVMLAAVHGSVFTVAADASAMTMIAEAVGTAFFVFGVSAAVQGKTPGDAAGLSVGGSLLIGILAASALGSNGVLNPAVAIGIGSISLAYLIAPLVGAVIGAWIYRWLALGR